MKRCTAGLWLLIVFVGVGFAQAGSIKDNSKRDLVRLYARFQKHLKVPAGILYEVDSKHVMLIPGRKIVLVTSEYALEKGYKGPSVLGLVLDADGTLVDLRILKSPDTPRFVQRVKPELKALVGRSLSEPESGTALAVTRATRTSGGINRTVQKTLAAFAPTFKRLKLTSAGQLYLDGKLLTPISTIK